MPFPNAATFVKAILFVVGYIIWDAAYTMANVPYGTMLNIVTEDAGERAQLSVFRSIGGAVGGMIPGMILPMLIWNKVTFDPANPTWFLDKIEIPADAADKFTPENFINNPVTGLPYEAGDKVLSPLTGGQIEVLLGDRVFWAALIMGLAIGIKYYDVSGAITFNLGPVAVSLSGLAVAAVVGIVLNAVLPGKDYEFGTNPQGDTAVNFGSRQK